MKKSSFRALIKYLNGENVPNIDEIKAEMEAELAKDEAKAQANRELYNNAHDVVISKLANFSTVNVTDLYEACKDELTDFSKSKLQYALLHYWDNEVISIDNGRNPKTYRLAEKG